MRTVIKGILVAVYFLMGLVTACMAQATEKIEVPLTKPGQPGRLNINLITGSIKVTGYKGKEVEINYATRGEPHRPPVREEAEGLRRLPQISGLEVMEDNNVVTIRTGPARAVDLDIKVPANFSVKLKTINGGDILVEDLEGELGLNNINGNIRMSNIAGTASASTINGNIIANFRRVAANVPMAFSSLNGKIDVSLPANAQFNAKLKTDNGDIYTDFDMPVNNPASKEEFDRNGRRIMTDKWLYGKINGGGPELLFKNFNGNIYIRKNK